MQINVAPIVFRAVSITLETQEDVNRFNNLLVSAIDSGTLTEDDAELAEGFLSVIDELVTGRDEEIVEDPSLPETL